MPRRPTGEVIARERADGRVFALRFRAYGRRHFVTLGGAADGWSRPRAEAELRHVLAADGAVVRGVDVARVIAVATAQRVVWPA